MKRYKPELAMPYIPETDNSSTMSIGIELTEDPGGEWVRWEDYKAKMQRAKGFRELEKMNLEAQIGCLESEIRRLKTTTITAKDGILKIKDVTDCNCKNGLDLWWGQWVCPKHGYKKR